VASALTEAPPPAELAAEAYRVVVDDPERARSLAGEALRRGADAAAASAAHRALGMAALELDDAATAVRHLERAVRAGVRGGPQQEAEARMSLALALVSQGVTRRALRQADRAAGLDGVPDRGALHLQRAIILERLGRLDEALHGYRLAVASFRRGGDRNGEARALCDRGVLQTYRGALGAAEADLRAAEAICDELSLTLMSASVRQNLGFVAAQRGDVPLALACYERAQGTFEPIGGTRYALLELDRCQLLLATGLVREARDSAERAVAALERTGMEAEVAEARLQRAEVALAERDWPTARREAGAAVREFTAQRRPTWAALARHADVQARWGAGDDAPAARDAGDGGAAARDVPTVRDAGDGGAAAHDAARPGDGGLALLAAARRAAAELERCGWSARSVQAHLLAARVALGLGRPRTALRDLEIARRARFRGPAAVRIAGWHAEALRHAAAGDPRAAGRAVARGLQALERDRAALGATELRSHAAAQAEELAALGLRFALARGRPSGVLALIERARAQTLQLSPARPPRDPELAAKLGELRAVAALAGEELRAGRPVAPLVRRQTRLEHEVRRRLLQVPGTRLLQPARRPSLRALRDALGERALIEYLRVDGELYAVTVAPRRARLFALGPAVGVERELELLRFAQRRMAAGASGVHRDNAAHAAARLERWLLEPLLAEVGERELVIVPTGPLHALAWAALPACATRPLSVAPSAALWLRASARRAGAPAERAPAPATAGHDRAGAPSARVLLAAGPGLGHAGAEVGAIAGLYDDAVTLTGGDARVEAVARGLRECDRAHLACHGSFRADNPLFSSLLLADGPLTVHDVESLGAAPRELVLSACDSGRSVVRAGDELLGLTSALLAIGAGVIVASTVEVPDAPTAALMVRLHERLRAGATPAHALAAARAAASDGDDDAETVARDAFLCFGAG
jgi:CHAT domain-containing protein/tetratricopeptide (TPR) repeat protein